jgi:predicted nucleic acid-binding protein
LVKFWDTSGLVPLFHDEPASRSVRQLLGRDSAVVTWWGTRVECSAVVARLVHDGRLDATEEQLARERQAELFAGTTEVTPGEEVRERAERLLAVHALRAGDALQLAAALVWARERPAGRDFVCLDGRLRGIARREGFTILPT